MLKAQKRKTLVDIDISIWGKVKHFAAIKNLSVNSALEVLLIKALNNNYVTSSGNSSKAISQHTSLSEVD
jgi:hypothetical protein